MYRNGVKFGLFKFIYAKFWSYSKIKISKQGCQNFEGDIKFTECKILKPPGIIASTVVMLHLWGNALGNAEIKKEIKTGLPHF